jgi:cellulose synthase/poly-beta-1,6-N-acetylglucosamine synthase-like glycosyltransferase
MSVAARPPSHTADRSALETPVDVLGAELGRLSGGNVVAAPPRGPVLRGSFTRREVRPGTFVPMLTGGDRVLVAMLTAGWAAGLLAFWWWWFAPAHRVGWTGTAINSALLLYLSLLPASFLVTVNRLRRFDPAIPVPPLRVAFVVTRAPSEPWPVAQTTLTAMLHQRMPYDYDVWLCDEDPGMEIRQWCSAQGVRVSTRRGLPAYHRTEWPRRTKCKEGNLSYFYDNWGYAGYDVVAQLDCDHVPQPTYLREMVRPFADPAIGFVAAPSVCDANADNSWAARGRLYREAFFHGPFQAGHNDGLSPVCIGSHYAVRTAALREIGGVGPELAEDFSTSFLLTSAGWQGAFAIDAPASGDGPLTFAAMITQEFQWSRSLQTLAYHLVPGHLPRLSWRLRFRYGHALLHYALLAITTIVGLSLPPIAAVTGRPWVQVNYVEFILRWGTVAVWPLTIALLLRRRGLMRPARAPLLSWEAWLGALSRWPYVAWGVAAATLSTLRPKAITFKVTPKSRAELEPLAVGPILPYLVIVIVMATAALVGERNTAAAGYVFLCLLAGVSYLAVAVAVSLLHAREAAHAAGARLGAAVRATVRAPLLLSLAAAPPLVLALSMYPTYAIRAFGW